MNCESGVRPTFQRRRVYKGVRRDVLVPELHQPRGARDRAQEHLRPRLQDVLHHAFHLVSRPIKFVGPQHFLLCNDYARDRAEENVRPRKQDVQTRSEAGIMRVGWDVGYYSLKPVEKWSSREALGALPGSKGTVHE